MSHTITTLGVGQSQAQKTTQVISKVNQWLIQRKIDNPYKPGVWTKHKYNKGEEVLPLVVIPGSYGFALAIKIKQEFDRDPDKQGVFRASISLKGADTSYVCRRRRFADMEEAKRLAEWVGVYVNKLKFVSEKPTERVVEALPIFKLGPIIEALRALSPGKLGRLTPVACGDTVYLVET